MRHRCSAEALVDTHLQAHHNLRAKALKTIFAHCAVPFVARAFNAEQVVAGRVVERSTLCRARRGDTDYGHFMVPAGNMVDRGAVGMAVEHHFGAMFGDDLAEELVALEPEGWVLQFGVRGMMDQHHP